MGDQPQPPSRRTAFSPDGLWWYDGSQWRPAISPDGLWRWNGHAWEPARAAARPGGSASSAGTAVAITVVAFVGILLFVSFITIIVLLTMGNQIANVFSNVAAALGS